MASIGSKVRPYSGREPYIFISYAHRNEAEVYRIIERMQAEGYRIWYDRGIDPGTEWADNIAERVASCDYFIAFITREYLQSTNCLDELSFARDKEKKRLLVYLTNVTLPDGISMRSNRLQAIHKYAYEQEEEFYEKLFRAKGIDSSLAARPGGSESGMSGHPEHRACQSAADPYTVEAPRQQDEKASAPSSAGLTEQMQSAAQRQPAGEAQSTVQRQSAGQGHSAGEPQPATALVASVWFAAARFAAMLWSRRRLLFSAAAVCIVLFLAAAGLFEKNGAGASGGRNDSNGTDTAEKEEQGAVLDPEDLGGLTFGMSLDEVRAILTAGGAAKENSAEYNAEGMLTVEYVPTGDAYGREAGSIMGTQTFHGRELRALTACFDAEGLYQVYYILNAAQDADGRKLLKELNSKYGSPSAQYELTYQWNMGDNVALYYFPVTDLGEDAVGISAPHDTYFDMRGFAWGMTPDEAMEAEAGQEAPLALTKSDRNTEGCPYQFYEGEWEIYGSPVELLTLNYVADQLVEIKYILSDRSFDRVVADCTALYGQGGALAQDGSAMGWNIRMSQPETGGSILIAFSVVRAENGVRVTVRDLELYQSLRGK